MAKLGLQLFTVMDEALKDFKGTIIKIAQMGYEGIEFPWWMLEKCGAKELYTFLKELQIELVGIVFGMDDMLKRYEEFIRYCKDSRCPAVVFPWIPEEYRNAEGYRIIAEKFNEWGRSFAEIGIKFLYHIHGYEFEQFDGKSAMEIMMEHFEPEYVNLEIDTYWVEWGGMDSLEFVRKYGDRSPYIHFKDMKDKESKRDTEVGSGIVEVLGIMQEGIRNSAEWFIVEQEQFDIPVLESAKVSLDNLKRIINENHIF